MTIKPVTILKANNLSKHFDGLKVIDSLSFTIFKNQVTGLIGPNGAGKTTLFNLLSGFDTPTSGTILFDDDPIEHLPPHRIARLGIARTFQIVKPFAGLTVLENTMIGALRLEKSLIKAKAKALDILRVLQLENEKDTLADCLTLPDKKRLEIARALAIQPKLLLLDEVMAGLRPVEIDQFINTIQHLKQHLDLTIMMIEHNMRAIMACCQRVIVLHQGQKIAVDTPNAIQQHPEVIKTYLGTGFTYPFQGKI